MESVVNLDSLANMKLPCLQSSTIDMTTVTHSSLANNNKIPLDLLFACLEEASEGEGTVAKKFRLQPNPISPLDVASSASSTSASSTQHSPIQLNTPGRFFCSRSRKPPEPIPSDKKDQAYYAKRRKNNDAAKRSRDARRMKEEQTAKRAAELEHENQTLKQQLQSLQEQLSYYRALKNLSDPTEERGNGVQKAKEEVPEMVKSELLQNTSVLLSLLNNASLFSLQRDENLGSR
uniref:BZIP domain-containing protein n=1 Tax=Bursaphelenchus xylophilus TaxID=6326 RepID=A0A1I7SDV4_BURXY